MTDQELAEAIHQRFDVEYADNNDIADRVRELLEANPPWEPVKGEPCWRSNGAGTKERVRFHDSSGSWDIHRFVCGNHSGTSAREVVEKVIADG